MKIPAVFLSHGAPTLAVGEGFEARAWAKLASELPRPRSILAVSAHWDTRDPEVSAAPRMETIYDFRGFPRELYEQKYPAPGAPDLARHVAAMLEKAGFACNIDSARGLDHGAWVPLKWMYPKADIPVTQLSVQSHRAPAHHLKLGQAIANLVNEDVLVLGTGGIVHNLGDLEWDKRGTREAAQWASQFNDWIADRAGGQAIDDLLAYREHAPNAERSHPTEDHFAPFFVALGAGGWPARRVDLGFDLGTLGLDGYVFGA
ncbi:MAG TPA: class III extradiol ring-cleavage dioxygenase [Usitatibacter sp.]|nr:class III extradiol ring-cleavage dioxygenase [Usitatibacter sp.]